MPTVFGHKPGANPPNPNWRLWTRTAPNVQQAQSDADVQNGYYVLPEAAWVTKIGGRARVKAGDPQVIWGVWKVGTSVSPVEIGALLARTNTLNVNSNSGALVEGVVQQVVLIPAGTRVAIGGVCVRGNFEVALDTVILPDDYLRFYTDPGVPSAPENPFGTYGNVFWDQRLGAWIEYEPNAAPTAPTGLSVDNNTAVSGVSTVSTTPTFRFVHADPDITAGRADRILRYAFRVIDAQTGVTVWPTAGQEATAQFAATAAEQVVGATIARAYPGATAGSLALVPGKTYQWQVQTQDLGGAWGAWSAVREFAPAEVGVVSLVGTAPTGKQDAPPATLGWQGRYFHPQGTQATKVQVEVRQNGATFVLGAEVAKTVPSSAAPGTLFTVTAGEAGIGDLPRGQSFSYRIRAFAGASWGDWSAEASFSTNAPPGTPVPVSPSDGAAATAPPVLAWVTQDPDEDDVEGVDVVWSVRLTRPSPLSQLVLTHPARAMAYDPGTSIATLALTGTDAPANGTYLWEVRADDLSASAVQAGYGQSPWSLPRSFVLSPGPTPTISLPSGSTVGSVTPLYRWAVANGPAVAYRVVVYEVEDGVTTSRKAWDSLRVASSALEVVQPEGYLRNGRAYDLEVTVWNGADQAGTTPAKKRFTVAYAPPAGVQGAAAIGWRNERDPENTSAMVSWLPSALAGDFASYDVHRRLQGEPSSARRLLRRITTAAQTRWWDHHVPTGVDLVYEITQRRRSGGVYVDGPAAEVPFRLDMDVIVIASAVNAGTDRAVLRWHPSRRAGSYQQAAASYVTWSNEQKPIVIAAVGTQQIADISARIVSDDQADRETHFRALERLYLTQQTVCCRDGRQRIFGKIESFAYEMLDDWDEVSLRVIETAYREGV